MLDMCCDILIFNIWLKKTKIGTLSTKSRIKVPFLWTYFKVHTTGLIALYYRNKYNSTTTYIKYYEISRANSNKNIFFLQCIFKNI